MKRSIWTRVADIVSGSPEAVDLESTMPVRLADRGVRVPLRGQTLQVETEQCRLHVCPDLPLLASPDASPYSLMVFDAERYYRGIGHFVRLRAGDSLRINPRGDADERLFAGPHEILRSSIRLRHEGDALVLRATPDLRVDVRTVESGTTGDSVLARRYDALRRLRQICAPALAGLSPQDALSLLRQVNRLMESEPCREELPDGDRSALVEIAGDKTPVIVGDLHGQVENLLTVLSHNAFLSGMEKREAVLILLGDAVHPDESNSLEDMDESVRIMDLIFQLKVAFPGEVFFLRGNHDSFSPDVMKQGVPQSLLWDKRLVELRDRPYRDEMARYYELCPLMAVSTDFVACHAGPPRMRVTRQMLSHANRDPGLAHALIWNRQHTKGHSGGYTASDVRQLRQALGLAEDAAFVVGHYPRSESGTIWMDAGAIKNHHVVISSRRTEVGVLTRVDGEFVAQTYAPEPLSAWVSGRESLPPRGDDLGA